MKVALLAYTVLTGYDDMRDAGWVDYPEDEGVWPDSQRDADVLAEFAGRGCYGSWGRPNPATATNEGYLGHIIDVQHNSVLEHASATFYVAGVSRSLLMELRTHRHLSFSAQSQRFVDESNATFIPPPAFAAAVEHQLAHDQPVSPAASMFVEATRHSLEFYKALVVWLESQGLKRKQAREAARSVLPNATETKFVVTGNMHAWRYVISRRIAPEADAEIRVLADLLLAKLREIAPNTFQDM